jgi:hypothetical protein
LDGVGRQAQRFVNLTQERKEVLSWRKLKVTEPSHAYQYLNLIHNNSTK